jgi:hypothetical protein
MVGLQFARLELAMLENFFRIVENYLKGGRGRKDEIQEKDIT